MENSEIENVKWNLAEKIAFRFVFIFFILFIVFQNNGAYPYWREVMEYADWYLLKTITWVGKHILSISYYINPYSSGSGDTTYNNIIVFCVLALSTFGSLIWSILDRRRVNYKVLYYWLTVAVRYYLAFTLFNYGLVKVIKLQFPSPELHRLITTYGESSPMGLAWTFLGFSKGYNMFMGIAEIAAAFLLFRRTMTFGAIITLMTTANVMAVNFCYDVPVKLLSTVLVLMTLFLLSRDLKRMCIFFFTGKAVDLPVIPAPEIKWKWLRIVKVSAKYLLIAYVIITGLKVVTEQTDMYGDNAPKPKLYGIYKIESIESKNDSLHFCPDHKTKWKQLIIDNSYVASIRMDNDSLARYEFFANADAKQIVLTPIDENVKNKYKYKGAFLYQTSDSTKLLLTGTIGRDSVSIVMNKELINENYFRLKSRGFNWINEKPYNR